MISDDTLNTEINKASHYNLHKSGIETIDVTRWLNFDLGNCWKYCMRYKNKESAEKDLLKALYYINDFTENFIDYNNDSTYIHKLPSDIVSNMCAIIDAEESPIIKAIFEQILSITTQNGIMDPIAYKNAIENLKKFAKEQTIN